jgi:hypothetical protein
MSNTSPTLRHALALLSASVAVVSSGCGNDPAMPTPGSAAAAPTYWNDVAPIVEAKCAHCHQPGGIAPFALTSYAQVKTMAEPVAAATGAGIMPPYYITHDGSCGQFDDHEALTPEEIATFQRWAASDRAEGTQVDRPQPAPLLTLQANMELRTPIITPVAQGGPLARNDEYRCFPMDTPLKSDRFIVGYDVLPGNPAIVHHLEAFLVNGDQVNRDGKTGNQVLQALDDADPERPGWPCFGSAADDLADQNVPIIWAPGQGPIRFPDGMGVRQRKGDRLVVQMHYNLSHSGHGGSGVVGGSDSTTLRLQYADSVEREAMVFPVDLFLASVFDPQPASLAPGQTSTRYTSRALGSQVGLNGVPYVEVVSMMPHMHGRGLRQEVRFRQPGGESVCTSKLERWDFDWQKLYFYEGERPRFTPDTEIEVTCDYDTSQDREPVLPGWGTDNEMCSAIMMVALPAGLR